MIQKFRYLTGRSNVRPVFVVGTGRSGTHWLGYSLESHPEIRATVERWPMFKWSVAMALNPALENRLLKPLVWAYRYQLLMSAPRHYLDKSHPNIWIADRLKEEFPDALFIGIERNPYATVASMIRNEGVSSWHNRWREFPVPNRFLGITPEISETYEDIPFASKCAMRWVAHHNRMEELGKILGGSIKIIGYEDFAHNTDKIINELQEFLGLTRPIPIPLVKTESLRKWEKHLSDKEIREIDDIVGFAPGASNIHTPG